MQVNQKLQVRPKALEQLVEYLRNFKRDSSAGGLLAFQSSQLGCGLKRKLTPYWKKDTRREQVILQWFLFGVHVALR